MKLLVSNCSCLQNPWLGGCRSQIPVLSVLCPQLNLLNPPRTKSLGTPLYVTKSSHRPDWWNYGMRKDFFGTQHSQFFLFLLADQQLHIVKNMCVYTYLTALTLYINYHCYQIVLWMKHFYTSQVWSEVLTGYLSLVQCPGGQWMNSWHWTKCLTMCFSNRK